MTDLMAQASRQAAGTVARDRGRLRVASCEHQSLRGAMAVSAAGDRLLLDTAADPPTGPVRRGERRPRPRRSEVPGDALYYSEARQSREPRWAGVIEPIKQAHCRDAGGRRSRSRRWRPPLGADLEELVSWIDDGAIAVGYDGSQPYGGLVLVPNDVDAARATPWPAGDLRRPRARWTRRSGHHRRRGGGRRRDRDHDPLGRWPTRTSMFAMPMRQRGRARVRGHRRPRAHRHRRRLRAPRPGPRRGRLAGARSPATPMRSRARGGARTPASSWLDLAGTREALETALGPMIESGDPDGALRVRDAPVAPAARSGRAASRGLEGDVLVQRAALLVE